MNLSEKIGYTMKGIRKKNNYKQEELAHKLGIAKSMMSRCENGVREIPLKIIQHFCAHFNLSLSQFFKKVEAIK